MGRNRPNLSEYTGDTEAVCAVEDSIRASKKYTEGVLTRRHRHPDEMQGIGIPSRAFCKYYEVYPDIDFAIGLDMKVSDFMDWVWGETRHINVTMFYDYRAGQATLEIAGGAGAVEELSRTIPGFREAVATLGNSHGKDTGEDITPQEVKRRRSARVVRQPQ